MLFTLLVVPVHRYECLPGCLDRSGKVVGTGYYDMVNDPQCQYCISSWQIKRYCAVCLHPCLHIYLTAAIQRVWSWFTLRCYWQWRRMVGCDQTGQKTTIHQVIQEWYSINWVWNRLCLYFSFLYPKIKCLIQIENEFFGQACVHTWVCSGLLLL